MRQTRRAVSEWLFFVAGIMAIGAPSARAQVGMPGAGRSLGGYGAATIGQYYSSGMTTYIPYNGNAGGYVSYQGGYAGGFGVPSVSRRLPQTPIGGISMPITPIGGVSTPGGMGAGGRGGGFAPFGYEGRTGLGAGMIGTPMTKQRGGRSPLGPGFGYPFRTPTNRAGGAAGMAVMAP